MLNSWNKHDTDINVIESLLGYDIEGGKYVDGRYMFLVMLNKNYMLKRYAHTHTHIYINFMCENAEKKDWNAHPHVTVIRSEAEHSRVDWEGMSSLGTLYILIHWNFPETLQS